jgi:hypothetical protein
MVIRVLKRVFHKTIQAFEVAREALHSVIQGLPIQNHSASFAALAARHDADSRHGWARPGCNGA